MEFRRYHCVPPGVTGYAGGKISACCLVFQCIYFLPRNAMLAWYTGAEPVCMSVDLFVTHRYSIKTAEYATR